MDVDDFIRCMLQLSAPLIHLFKINVASTYTCQECFDFTCRNIDIRIGLSDSVTSNSIKNIIKNNRTSFVQFDCNTCKDTTNHIQRETFISLPDVLMIQAKRFEARIASCINPEPVITLNNINYILKSVIIYQRLTRNEGHYFVVLREPNGGWIKCNDNIIENTSPPLTGDIFFYEKESICRNESSWNSVTCGAQKAPVSNQQKTHLFDEDTNERVKDKRSLVHGSEAPLCENISMDNDLNTYIRTHTKEKTYQCIQCDKSFLHDCDLLQHKKTHIGEKPYQCSQCNKSFSRNYDFLRI